MAEINAKDLTAKTSPASTDSMLLFGTTSNEGAKITVDNLADNILSRLTTKTFANQVGGSSAATILAQLATLNSNINDANTYKNMNSYSTLQEAVDALFNTGGKCHAIYLNGTLASASGLPSAYMYGFVFVDSANFKTVILYEISGAAINTINKSTSGWGTPRRITIPVYNG